MTDDIRSAVDFYTRHPISVDIVLEKLKAARGHLENVRPEELFAHDQDHYGGLAANDALAARAGLSAGMRIADFCAGLGGPARYFAHRYGVDVTGIELTPARVEGARRLTQLVGLDERVRVLDVSGFTTVPQFERQPEAGWREWKFRSHDLYRANARLSTPVRRPSRRRALHRSHPQPNPFLEAWALSRDIPLGGLCHAIQSCQNLT